MYKCRICGKEFKTNSQLGGHMKNAHPDAPVKELIKQGTGPAQPAQPAALPAEQAEQPAGEALLESKGVEIGEVLEIEADEMNVRLRINPAVFYLYEIFKAETKRRGNEWQGEIGDFLYMAAKDALAVHGIYPSVITLKGGQMAVVKEEE
jgi:hypothetical protein